MLPAHAELAPVLEVRVAAAHRGELIARPLIGVFQVGRAGQARPDIVVQRGGILHHMGVAEAFVANALIHTVIEGLTLRLRLIVGRLVRIGRGFRFVGCSDGESKSETNQEREAGTEVSTWHRAKYSIRDKNFQCCRVADEETAHHARSRFDAGSGL